MPQPEQNDHGLPLKTVLECWEHAGTVLWACDLAGLDIDPADHEAATAAVVQAVEIVIAGGRYVHRNTLARLLRDLSATLVYMNDISASAWAAYCTALELGPLTVEQRHFADRLNQKAVAERESREASDAAIRVADLIDLTEEV